TRGVVKTLGWRQLGNRGTTARDGQQTDLLLVVRTLVRHHSAEGELVARNLHALADLQGDDLLALPSSRGDDAEHHQADSGVCQRGAIGRARQAAGAAPDLIAAGGEQLHASRPFRDCAGYDPYAQRDAERGEPGSSPEDGERGGEADQ